MDRVDSLEEWASRSRQFQNGQRSAGSQDAPHFLKGGGTIGDIAQAEGADDTVKTRITEGECRSITGLIGDPFTQSCLSGF